MVLFIFILVSLLDQNSIILLYYIYIYIYIYYKDFGEQILGRKKYLFHLYHFFDLIPYRFERLMKVNNFGFKYVFYTLRINILIYSIKLLFSNIFIRYFNY